VTKRAFQTGGIEKSVHEEGLLLIFACNKLNVILHTKVLGPMKSVSQNVLLTYLKCRDYTNSGKKPDLVNVSLTKEIIHVIGLATTKLQLW
jgi:hypothetical protein